MSFRQIPELEDECLNTILMSVRKFGELTYKEVYLFCEKYSICIPEMDDVFVARGRPRRVAEKVTKLHHYKNELFTNVIDWVLCELNSRFHEAATELLLCMACLSPDDSFSSFNKEKLVKLAHRYPLDFSETDVLVLENQHDTYIFDMKSSVHFTGLKGVGYLAAKLVETKKNFIYPLVYQLIKLVLGVGYLAAKLVETKKNFIYPLVYQLIKLVLVLPVSTASVERSFSAMKIVKTRLE
ncbi:hypothetical protein LXL04_012601 [Taraxacum kok-saghyz]